MTNAKYYNASDPTNADRVCLDLSNTGIKDITELCQFSWPQTLVAINLANNGLVNSDLLNIIQFTKIKADQQVPVGDINEGKEVTAASNLSTIIKNINLCFNDLDLSSITSTTLTDTKFLFGVQGISHLDKTKLIQNDELNNTKYYFRESDLNIVSPVLKRNGSNINYTIGQVKGFTDDGILGEITSTVGGVTSSPSGYYYGWSQSENFSVFTLTIRSDFKIERKAVFNLPADKIIMSPEINGKIQVIGNPITKDVGTQTVNIRVTANNGLTRVVSRSYTVVDTTAPTLSLVGPSTIYWSKNKAFDHTKYTCKAIDSGDDISDDIVKETNLDVTQITTGEPYYIRYNVSDGYNNATPVIRYVYIQEQALDTIILRCNTQDTTTGSDLVLEVKPDDNIPMKDYEDFTFEYRWYVNGKLEHTTTGDFKGRSTQSFIFDTIGMREIKVELIATDGTKTIELSSETLYLDIEAGMDNTQIIIIACSVAILLCIIFFSVRTIIKVRRAKNGVAKKSSKTKKVDDVKKQQIKIVSGENPNNPNGFTVGGEGGGNSIEPLQNNNIADNNNNQMGQ